LRREVEPLLGANRRELAERAHATLGFDGGGAAAAELLALARARWNRFSRRGRRRLSAVPGR
jgi:hypothetical protein